MPPIEPQQEAVFVLRRLTPKQWDRRVQEVLETAFTLRFDETGLSIYDENIQSPRTILQKVLDEQQERYKDDPQGLANWHNSNGSTVEEMIKKNWRVARVPMSAFPPDTFSLTPQEPDGHQEIVGTAEDFQTYGVEIAGKATLCTPEECLE